MAIKVKQSNHKLLFGLFKSLALKVLRPVIQKAVEKQVRDNVHKLDGMLFSVKKEADRAAEEAKNNPDPENLENIYQRYFNAFQRELQKGQKKKEDVEAKAADTKVSSKYRGLTSPVLVHRLGHRISYPTLMDALLDGDIDAMPPCHCR